MDITEWMLQLAGDELEHIEDSIRTGGFEMTYTISIYRGSECKAVTCLNCKDVQDAIARVLAANPGWFFDTVQEGW